MTSSAGATGENDAFVIVTVPHACCLPIVGALIVARGRATRSAGSSAASAPSSRLACYGVAEAATRRQARRRAVGVLARGTGRTSALLPWRLRAPPLSRRRLPSPRWRAVAWRGGGAVARVHRRRRLQARTVEGLPPTSRTRSASTTASPRRCSTRRLVLVVLAFAASAAPSSSATGAPASSATADQAARRCRGGHRLLHDRGGDRPRAGAIGVRDVLTSSGCSPSRSRSRSRCCATGSTTSTG